jgi:cytochrome c oxidase cbb3-type subunit 4
LSFVVFAGIVAWAWSSRNRQAFDEAALLPFADEARLGGRHE